MFDDYDDDMDGLGALIDPDAEGYDAPDVPRMRTPQRVTRIVSNYLYSAYYFAAGALAFGRYALFVQAVNEVGQGFVNPLTPLHTNLVSGGRTPDGEAWTISHIGLVINPGSDPDDVVNFMRYASVGYTKRSYDQTIGPALFWPGGAGLSGPVATTVPGADTRELCNGAPAASAMAKLQTPLELGSGESFRFYLDINNWGPPTEDLKKALVVWVKLYGRNAQDVPQ